MAAIEKKLKALVEELAALCGSLREASRQTGIPHPTLINWRNGKVPRVLVQIEKIEEFLRNAKLGVGRKERRAGKV